ncbi:hypothetical protein COOONC_12698 [Cooperia oncophora]
MILIIGARIEAIKSQYFPVLDCRITKSLGKLFDKQASLLEKESSHEFAIVFAAMGVNMATARFFKQEFEAERVSPRASLVLS